MRNKYGITESFWIGLVEDKKMRWKLISWTIAFIVSFFVYKTGIRFLDWLIWGFTALVMFLIIESQRNLRKYSSIFRKQLIRAIVMLGVSGVFLPGIVLFATIGYGVTRMVFLDLDSFSSIPPPILHLGNLGMILFIGSASAIALFKTFRDLRFEEILYRAPLSGLKSLLIKRSFVADNFSKFVLFELGVILFASYYFSFVAVIVQVFVNIVKINS